MSDHWDDYTPETVEVKVDVMVFPKPTVQECQAEIEAFFEQHNVSDDMKQELLA